MLLFFLRYAFPIPKIIIAATSNAARASWLAFVLTLPLAIAACGLWLDDEAKIERAKVALENQQYSAAIIDAKNVLLNAPDNAVARIVLGRALAANGEFEAAESHLQQALGQGQSIDDFRVALTQARLMTGQPEQALMIADPTAAGNDKEAFFLWLYRGDALADLGETADALRAYEQAEHFSFDKATALLRAAEIYLDAGNLKDAEAFAESALLDDPGNLDVHLTLGTILMDSRNWQGAQEILTHTNTALRLDAISRGYVLAALAESHLALNDVTAAREAFDRVAELWSADDPELSLLKGQIAMAEGDNETAATALLAYLVEFPESEAAMRMLGAAHLGLGLVQQARLELVRALAADPDQVETRYLLARTYLEIGQIDRAREVLESSLDLAARDANVLSLLGVIDLPDNVPRALDDPYKSVRNQLIRGEIGQALATATKAVRDRHDAPQALNLLGLCQLANEQGLQAIESFSRALAAEPDNERHQLNLARAHLANGAPEEGLKVLESLDETDLGAEASVLRRALVIDLHESNNALWRSGPELLSRWLGDNPDDTGVRLLLAQTYTDNGSFASAATQYELLLEQGLDDPLFHNNLAWSYLELGDNRALEHAEHAYELSPNDGEVADTLGWILVSQGELDRGPSLLRDAHILRPGDQEIAYHLAYALSRIGAEGEAEAMLEGILNRGTDAIRESASVLLSKLRQDH